jgi:anti-sigma B factor antagonist
MLHQMSSTLTIRRRTEGNVEVVALAGRLDAATSQDLERELNAVMDAGVVRIVASLSGLDYISSSGLRVILAALKRLKKSGGDLKLAEMTQAVSEVITMTGFSRIFGVYASESEAVSSFVP